MKNNIEIKFRAWDIEKKEMFNVYDIVFYPGADENLMDGELSKDNKSPSLYFGNGKAAENNGFPNLEQVKLMQYTGLRDRTGNEIYFGDILATRDYGIWDKEEYGYTTVLERKDELGVTFSNWHPVSKYEEDIYSMKFVEIIGNIYETPYLIKE